MRREGHTRTGGHSPIVNSDAPIGRIVPPQVVKKT